MTDNELHLDGLIYRSLSVDSLQIEVNIESAKGKVVREIINCGRVDK
jgi:hypothetical protein